MKPFKKSYPKLLTFRFEIKQYKIVQKIKIKQYKKQKQNIVTVRREHHACAVSYYYKLLCLMIVPVNKFET